ncbi:MAG: SlyX family protein [Mailhella sp.]|nr:SlyX family protein [Mailhella sp.]
MDAQEKIARLEELSWFQEKLLAQLNEALTGQQRQLDMMEKRLLRLEEHVSMLMLDAQQEAPVNALPPHYMPERY